MTKVWGTAGDETLVPRSAWDVVYLGGRALPGVARVSGKGVEHGIDVKKTPGKDGSTFTDLGRDLARFTVVLVLQSQTDWDGFEAARGTFQPLNSTGKLEAISVAHPAINSLGITSAYMTRVGMPHPGSVSGTFEVELEFLEYRRTKVGSGSGKGGAHTPKKDVKEHDPNTRQGRAARAGKKPSKTNTGP